MEASEYYYTYKWQTAAEIVVIVTTNWSDLKVVLCAFCLKKYAPPQHSCVSVSIARSSAAAKNSNWHTINAQKMSNAF